MNAVFLCKHQYCNIIYVMSNGGHERDVILDSVVCSELPDIKMLSVNVIVNVKLGGE